MRKAQKQRRPEIIRPEIEYPLWNVRCEVATLTRWVFLPRGLHRSFDWEPNQLNRYTTMSSSSARVLEPKWCVHFTMDSCSWLLLWCPLRGDCCTRSICMANNAGAALCNQIVIVFCVCDRRRWSLRNEKCVLLQLLLLYLHYRIGVCSAILCGGCERINRRDGW